MRFDLGPCLGPIRYVVECGTPIYASRVTTRITGPGVDVDERSERETLFRLRFIRLISAS